MSTPCIVPSPVHRIIARRSARVSRALGTPAVLDMYDRLPPREQRLVFAVLARAAAGLVDPIDLAEDTVTEAPTDEADWTEEELRLCHALFCRGQQYRTDYVRTGERIYQRLNKRKNRPVVNGRGEYQPWLPEEDAAIMAPDRPTTRELAARLGRSIGGVESRRTKLRRHAAQSLTSVAS